MIDEDATEASGSQVPPSAEYAPILFIDFDGVTHREGCSATELFNRLPSIEAILRRHPDVFVVISSSWRRARTLAQLTDLFSEDIAQRVIGVTPHLDDEPAYQRQAECMQWIRSHTHPWTRWAALDDQQWLFRPFCPNLIAVPWRGAGVGPVELANLDAKLHSISHY
ncbi:MAG TPA: HAD domain-containing protein [Burkholderiaceae bacterium]|jgi:hypothetical protein